MSAEDQHGGPEVANLKGLVEFIAKALVSSPDAVEITETEREHLSILELRVAQEDLGKVIGKQGRTARAIRAVLQAASSKGRRRVTLEIRED